MKFLLATLALLCFAVNSTVAVAAALPATCTTAIPYDSCAFYTDCLEATFPCGSSGYALGYGNKFCNAFQGNASSFSVKGKKWISDVMHCLETELVPVVTSTTAPSCPQIKTIAFDSHPKCYLQAGVCTLPLSDWFALAKVVGIKQLIGDLAAIKQEILVVVGCPAKWLQVLLGKLRE